MATARLILQGHVDDFLPESIPLPVTWALTSAVYIVQQNTIGNGDNTYTVPSSPTPARLLIMIPPATVTYTKKWKGAGGDTGVSFDQYLAMIKPVVAGSTFIINSGGAETSPHTFIYL